MWRNGKCVNMCVCVSVCVEMERPDSDWSLLQITDITSIMLV